MKIKKQTSRGEISINKAYKGIMVRKEKIQGRDLFIGPEFRGQLYFDKGNFYIDVKSDVIGRLRLTETEAEKWFKEHFPSWASNWEKVLKDVEAIRAGERR